MKNLPTSLRWLLIFSVFISFLTQLNSCKKDSHAPAPSISGFSPSSGIVGTTVTITGTNFSATPSSNTVTFNGSAATVTDATATQLTVTVPQEATTGTIAVTTSGVIGTSTDNFTILSPTISSFTPNIGSNGVTVVITGTNYSPTTGFDVVKFNGTAATVTAATSTQITATVPASVTAGKISVQVGPNTVTTTDDFAVCNGNAELVLISGVTITNISLDRKSFTYSFDLANTGTVGADLSKMSIQAYASTDNSYSVDDLAASGWTLGSTTLGAAQAVNLQFDSNIVGGGTVDDHPYLIFIISGSVSECNTANNTVVKSIL